MTDSRLKRKAKSGWVPLEKMRVREGVSQREFRPAWANEIARDFKIEKFGIPIVNQVGDWFWILDGAHRIGAFKQWLGDWKNQKAECLIYQDLSEKEEADLFLGLNAVKAVSALEKHIASVTAGHEEATNIDAIVRLKGLKISQYHGEGAVACVSTLGKVYRRGADCLARGLEIAHESYGNAGLEADVIDGIGLLISRYNGRLDDKKAIRQLSATRGGVNGLRTRAGKLREQTGVQRAQCIAAAAVEIINRGKGGKKLPGWWKSA